MGVSSYFHYLKVVRANPQRSPVYPAGRGSGGALGETPNGLSARVSWRPPPHNVEIFPCRTSPNFRIGLRLIRGIVQQTAAFKINAVRLPLACEYIKDKGCAESYA